MSDVDLTTAEAFAPADLDAGGDTVLDLAAAAPAAEGRAPIARWYAV